MIEHSLPLVEQRATDRAALSEVETSELEAVNGGGVLTPYPTPLGGGAYSTQYCGESELNIKKTAVLLNDKFG
jgi:hypothetical protein